MNAQSGYQTERDDMKQNKTRPEWVSDRERDMMTRSRIEMT